MANTYNKKGVIDTHDFDESHISDQDQNVFDTYEDDEINYDIESIDEKTKELLCAQCETMKEAEDMRLRTIAEMDNFKKRLQREKDEQVKYAAENVLSDIIPSLDNLDLALQYANNDACKDILMGVQMTRKLLLDSLKNHGLEVICATNVPFDPELHEAMGQEETTDIPEKFVSKILQKGYVLKDRLLRPAKVMVAK